MKQKILITGASGFVGSFLVEEALRRGMEVWAAVRPTSSRQWLSDERINFLPLHMADYGVLREEIEAHVREHGSFDSVIHAAGATKAKNREAFLKNNTTTTLNLAKVLVEAEALKGRMVYMSSLSVMGAIHENDGKELTDEDTAQPNTAYGESKLAAERELEKIEKLDYIVLRPTGIYGPRERDYFLMAKSISQHIDFSVGFKPQVITFIYVRDVVQAAFLALEKGRSRKAYFLSDGAEYSSRDFSDLLQKEMGVRRVLHVCAPLWVLRLVCTVSQWLAGLRNKQTTLNMDKYNILCQRNWRCSIEPARSELHFKPEWTLARGVEETVGWYKAAGWI